MLNSYVNLPLQDSVTHPSYLLASYLDAITGLTGKSTEGTGGKREFFGQVIMEVLYWAGGLKGRKIGRLLGIGYTTVSQERRRLRERLRNDRNLQALFTRPTAKCNE